MMGVLRTFVKLTSIQSRSSTLNSFGRRAPQAGGLRYGHGARRGSGMDQHRAGGRRAVPDQGAALLSPSPLDGHVQVAACAV